MTIRILDSEGLSTSKFKNESGVELAFQNMFGQSFIRVIETLNTIMTPADAIETASEFIWLDENDVLHYRCKEIENHSLAHAKENCAAAGTLCQGEAKRSLVDLRKVNRVSREARQFYSGPENAKVMRVTAFIVGSPVSALIANFFIGIDRPAFQVQVFHNEAKAYEWLCSK